MVQYSADQRNYFAKIKDFINQYRFNITFDGILLSKLVQYVY